jgi:hypothetical protein
LLITAGFGAVAGWTSSLSAGSLTSTGDEASALSSERQYDINSVDGLASSGATSAPAAAESPAGEAGVVLPSNEPKAC